MSTRTRESSRAASEDTRNQLKAAAQMLFARHGVDAVTVQQIVSAAGQRNNAALHYHFGSKEELIRQLVVDGATVLEPHRHDSVGWFNRWESTFQSIRRRAIVRVIPDPNGYLVEVVVLKELEDLPKPEKGTVGPSTFGSELTMPSQRLEEVVRTHPSPRWIPMGRDPALEQRMLSDIPARLNGVTTQRSVFGD